MIDATRTGREGAPQQPGRLGERLRQLRIGAGLTQTELAGARFSKEYVSQIERVDRARSLSESPECTDVDRADVLFRLGVCRFKLSSIATSLGLLDEALKLAERSGLPCDLLRSRIHGWRSRCYRLHRDWEAA